MSTDLDLDNNISMEEDFNSYVGNTYYMLYWRLPDEDYDHSKDVSYSDEELARINARAMREDGYYVELIEVKKRTYTYYEALEF